MRASRAIHETSDGRHYAHVESLILDLQLSVSSVRRANGCLDLDIVRRIRAHASETLERVELRLTYAQPDPLQARRLAERRRALASLLREPAPIEQLARSLHVG
jgi:hypothetical protein